MSLVYWVFPQECILTYKKLNIKQLASYTGSTHVHLMSTASFDGTKGLGVVIALYHQGL